ncbi:MAG: sensor histidine kinase [Pseudomonadota bacterium]
MRLATFITKNMEDILRQWEIFARSIQPIEGEMNKVQLRDHAEAMLKVIAIDLATPQTDRESIRKSEGKDPKADELTAAHRHAGERLHAGFSIKLMVSEYRALRSSVLRLWLQSSQIDSETEVGDIIRFNEAIDQALAESVENFAQLVAESQDTFLGILGHDLRAPLQSVSLGATYLMRSPDADGKLIQLGARMYNSAMRMGEMLDALLDYTRIRIGGGLAILLRPTDLALVCAQLIEEFLASNPGRLIRSTVVGDCSGSWDGGRIGQVYQNLIGNALQYSAADSAIEIAMQGTAENVVFSICNQGNPIPAAEQRNVFAPMRRHVSAQPEDAFRSKNLGLGLYIASQVVVAHNGSIDLRSSEAEGTVFTVTLPKSADKK